MAVNRDLIETIKKTDEYKNGLTILGDPDDYATDTIIQFIGFFFIMTIHEKGNIEGLNQFIRQMGITAQGADDGIMLHYEDEEGLLMAFTYIVGRNSKEYFELVSIMTEESAGKFVTAGVGLAAFCIDPIA